jgi:fatty acid desaturase
VHHESPREAHHRDALLTEVGAVAVRLVREQLPPDPRSSSMDRMLPLDASTGGHAEREQHEQLELLEGSDAYGLISVAKNFVPLLVVYAGVPYLAALSYALAWCCAPLVGLLLYRLTMVMHDCGHATLFTKRSTNDRVGKFLGYVTGVDFGRFKQLHWEHHRCYGLPGDPQRFHYTGLSRMSRGELAWHLLKPLLGLNVRYVFRESLLHPSNLRASSASALGLLAIVQLALLLLVTGGGRHPPLALLPFASAATFALFLSQLRGISEHGVGEPGQPQTFVRSHAREPLGSLLLYDVHFNFHEEHHRYPGVPSRHLPALARHLAGGRPMRTMWHTLRTLAR